MRRIFICLVLFLAVSIVSQAQENKEYEAAMVKMLEVSKTMDAMKQLAPQITAMMKQQATAEVPADFWNLIEKQMVSMYEQIIKAMLPIYQKYLTLGDIKEIIRFYESPVGKKLADSNTKIAMEAMPVAQQIAMENMQKIQAEMKEKGYIK